ncbi:hypothetical protein ACJVDH_12995 [Pedobacter sp. AW1-32]|uniref:hypothetical protein n=1 Tax=Pedobacter sp. AW1-32 TaxID=3383026 RepID=UPI003FEF0543
MTINSLKNRPELNDDLKLAALYEQIAALLDALNGKNVPTTVTSAINTEIDEINASTLKGNDFKKLLKLKQTAILKLLDKELKYTPQNYHRNLWMLFGMTAFGLPIGVAIAMSIGNMGLLGIGLPIGIAIGLSIGISLDKKALEEGRQLNLEIKH